MAASKFAQFFVEKNEVTFKIEQQQNFASKEGCSDDFQRVFEWWEG